MLYLENISNKSQKQWKDLPFETKLETLVGKFRTVMFVHLFTIGEFCFRLQVRSSRLDTSKGSFTASFCRWFQFNATR